MLDDARPGRLAVGVVDGGVALEVGHVQKLRLKAHGAVLQRAQAVAEVGVDGAGVDHAVRQRVQLGLVLQVVAVQPHLDALQQVLHQLRIAADGDALVEGVEVVVVEGQAHRQALDDEGGQLRAVPAPLLFRVALDQLFKDVAADQADGLLLQVLRLAGDLGALLVDLRPRLLRRHHAPHLVEGVHVEGQRVQLALVVGHRRVGEAVEVGEAGHVVPHLFVVGVEDVRAVLVHVDALHVLGVHVAGDVGPLVDHQHLPARVRRLAGEGRPEQAGADDEIVVHDGPPCLIRFHVFAMDWISEGTKCQRVRRG